METKKVLGIIFSIIFVCAFAFVLSWAIINFNKVKDGMSSTGVYTKEDINKSYEDGYNTALIDKEEYTNLINSYRDTITTLNDNISQLNSQVTLLTNNNKDYVTQIDNLNKQKTNLETQVSNLSEIKTANETTIASLNEQIEELQAQVTNLTNSSISKAEQINQLNSQITTLQNTVAQLQATNEMNVNTITSLNTQISNLNAQISDMTLQSQNSQSQINALNNKINELQASVTYYESYIASLENGEQVVATFEFDGSVYNIQIVNKGSKLSVTTPTSTDYKIFNGWTVNGSAIDLNTFVINANTKIVADVTYKYDVKFKVDNTIYNSQIVTKNGSATLPTNPTKTGYEFDGWSLNGVDIVSNINTKQVSENTTYVAVFTKLHTVKFMYEDTIKSTQSIRNGNYSNNVSVEDTTYKIFNGWKVNNTIVNIDSYKIVSDTVFIADITYKYDVIFKVEDTVYNSQIVTKNSCATLPTNPTKDGYEFKGWSINGTDIVANIEQIAVTQNTTYVAIFERKIGFDNAFQRLTGMVDYSHTLNDFNSSLFVVSHDYLDVFFDKNTLKKVDEFNSGVGYNYRCFHNGKIYYYCKYNSDTTGGIFVYDYESKTKTQLFNSTFIKNLGFSYSSDIRISISDNLMFLSQSGKKIVVLDYVSNEVKCEFNINYTTSEFVFVNNYYVFVCQYGDNYYLHYINLQSFDFYNDNFTGTIYLDAYQNKLFIRNGDNQFDYDFVNKVYNNCNNAFIRTKSINNVNFGIADSEISFNGNILKDLVVIKDDSSILFTGACTLVHEGNSNNQVNKFFSFNAVKLDNNRILFAFINGGTINCFAIYNM